MNTALHTVSLASTVAESIEVNPIGSSRMLATGKRMPDSLTHPALPGVWRVNRAWEENGIWHHDIERIE